MFPAQVGERLDFPHTLPTAHFWKSLWACGTGDGSGERRGGWYLAKVLGGASAILMTQALVVLCFAVATLCCFLEVGKGGRVVPIPHVLCPCKKAQGVNFPWELPHILGQVPTSFFLSFWCWTFAYISLLQIFHWFAIHISGFCPPLHHSPLGNRMPISLWD